MSIIDDNNFTDNELKEKISDFLGPRLEEIEKSIYDLISSANAKN